MIIENQTNTIAYRRIQGCYSRYTHLLGRYQDAHMTHYCINISRFISSRTCSLDSRLTSFPSPPTTAWYIYKTVVAPRNILYLLLSLLQRYLLTFAKKLAVGGAVCGIVVPAQWLTGGVCTEAESTLPFGQIGAASNLIAYSRVAPTGWNFWSVRRHKLSQS